MKYYTSTISVTLAEKLKEKGMPIRYEFIPNYLEDPEGEARTIIVSPNYGFVFDWLIEKDVFVKLDITDKDDGTLGYVAEVIFIWNSSSFLGVYSSWHEAANAAIEKALTLI